MRLAEDIVLIMCSPSSCKYWDAFCDLLV